MAGTKKKLKSPVRRVLLCALGTVLGVVFSLRVNAAAPITNIDVEEGRISVDDYEYFKMPTVIKATLPQSLQQIGFSAFEGCTSLSVINLPEGLSVIDNRAFAKCESLEKIDIPQSTVFIGNAAFYGCTSLDDVVLPENMSAISNNLFYNCASLKNITFPAKLTSIGQQSFYNCRKLSKLEIPNTVTTIADGAFYDCKGLTEIIIPDSVTDIGLDAFEGCDALTIVCDDHSYAAGYAESNAIRHTPKAGEMGQITPISQTENTESIIPEDIPATGVNTPYAAVLAVMAISVIGLAIISRSRAHYYLT